MSGTAYAGILVEGFDVSLIEAIRTGVREAGTSQKCAAWLERFGVRQPWLDDLLTSPPAPRPAPSPPRIHGVALWPYAGACWVALAWEGDPFDLAAFELNFADDFAAAVAARTGTCVWSYLYHAQSALHVAASRFAPTGEELESHFLSDEPEAGGEERVHANVCARIGWPPFVLGASGAHVAPAWLSERVKPLYVPLGGPFDPSPLVNAPEPEPTPFRGSVHYFPGWMHHEICAVAAALRWSFDDVMQCAWERAKHALFDATVPEAPEDVRFPRPEPGPTRSTSARAPGVVAHAITRGGTVKVARHVWFEQIEEVRLFAIAADHSWSWVLQKAYTLARPSLVEAHDPA